jgi:ribosomal protein L10
VKLFDNIKKDIEEAQGGNFTHAEGLYKRPIEQIRRRIKSADAQTRSFWTLDYG